ncbi:Mov34/MPN/PAD-1 family protein [Lysinibacillus fusiformis]|uniref:Mov34/MPN/PAD-1 family protein n=1 Tax=Lysinibacillus TaxID=400634 RepID=UPI001967100F|nr:Mov34/MPN/PAD-1 family protein [Lysinibacillus fusiformis]QSB10108.1 Mov34/MPN/PAD-1 family protein [Lysinibacillus fusiformis]
MSDLLYLNDVGSFGVEITDKMVNEIYELCEDSFPNETGGILIGHYSSDLKRARVTIATGAPSDSKCGKSWFYRGTNGLQNILDEAWNKKGDYYLGEWHFHPCGNTIPSNQDIREMKNISVNKGYNCPEPILIIASNTSSLDWDLGLFVFDSHEGYKRLENVKEKW